MEIVPFSRIIGQDRAVLLMKRAMARDKMPHAYLFVGIHGVGKTTTALALAQALNCLDPVEGEGCGKCSVCRQLAGGNFPDLAIVEPDGQAIKIEQIRELNRSFSYRPLSGRYRVTILRRAEAMTEEAANSFLKTLEEPPRENILILGVTEPLDLLPTIVSRCQKVSFRPIPPALIAKWLQEEKGIEAERARVLANLAEGSLGRALGMEEEGFLEKREGCLDALFRIPFLPHDELLDLARGRPAGGRKSGGDRSGIEELEPAEVLALWKTCFRDLILLKTAAEKDRLIHGDFLGRLKSFSENYTIHALIRGVHILDRSERELRRGRNLDLMMENTILALKRLSDRPGRGVPLGDNIT
ncbi:MAG: DNA polymerase III subunit delta' [Deltaproteobacteria bacterium]|nr:DNA polymerase III subunit delta' [Deltaproteobacteria bacterium]